MPSSATRSPALRFVTPVPTSATSPAISCPGQTVGIIISSWYQWRSEPQMPQFRTRTTTSPAPGVGRSTSSSTRLPAPRQKAACIVARLTSGAACPATSAAGTVRGHVDVGVLAGEAVTEEAPRCMRVLERRVEEGRHHRLRETVLAVGLHGWIARERTEAGKRAARGVDPGLRAAEPVDDVAAGRDDARNCRATDRVVARGGGRADRPAEGRVGRVDECDERARRP